MSEPRFDWRQADTYARNYVLGRLIDLAVRLERKAGDLQSQRAYATRAAIVLLSKEATDGR